MQALRRLARLTVSVVAIGGAASCGSEGAVTITVQVPSYAAFNPVGDELIQYELRAGDSVLAVASASGKTASRLQLGTLTTAPMPEDLSLSLAAGTELIGMARLRDVTIKNAKKTSYVADVRKPIFLVGSQPTSEYPSQNLAEGEILDPTSSSDLAHPADGSNNAPKLPANTGPTAVTWDGRFVLAASGATITVVDSGAWTTIGSQATGVTISRLLSAPHDTAVAALSSDAGVVLLYTDVAGLGASPSQALPIRVDLKGEMPRAAAFSADGSKLYVLTGGDNLDPCGHAAPPANRLLTITLDGNIALSSVLSAFAGDITVDVQTNTIVVSLPNANHVSKIESATDSSISPIPLFDAVCPSAVRAQAGQVYAVTSTQPQNTDSYVLRSGQLTADDMPISTIDLPFPSPFFSPELGISGSTDAQSAAIELKVQPTSIYAYEMAIAPDGERAVFAMRTHYDQLKKEIGFGFNDKGLPTNFCELNVNVIEYGLFNVDLRNGTARYETHSSFIVNENPPNCDLVCGDDNTDPNAFQGSCVMSLTPLPSDTVERPGGLSAFFGTY